MKMMLLAAGLGRRLLPLTLSRPKASIPVLGRPLAVQILCGLGDRGVEGAVVNLHHLPEYLKNLLKSENYGCLPPLEFVYEPEILGTAGALRNAAARLRGNGPILVRNSDFLADIDVAAAIEAHNRSGNAATLVLTGARPGYSAVDVDSADQVLALAGRPEVDARRVAGSHLFTGLHVIDEEIIDLIPPEGPSHIVTDVYLDLAAQGRLGAWFHDGFWWEFGSPQLYLEGTLRLLDLPGAARNAIAVHDPVRDFDQGCAAIGAGAVLGAGIGMRGRCAIGFASRIGAATEMEDSVVLPESWVGPGCRLRRAVVGPGVEIPADYELEEVIVCGDPGGDPDLPGTIERRDGLLILPIDPVPA